MRRFVAAAVAALALASCATWWRAEFFQPGVTEPPGPAPFLKCHGTAGELWVLEQWDVSPERRVVSGRGRRYDADRRRTGEGAFEIPFDRVALAETNAPQTVARSGLIVLGVLTAASAGATVACAVNPKACFGSCPTFYTRHGAQEVLQAEGFSGSVTRALEAEDVDAIDPPRPLGEALELEMRNEALETHLVRSVRLLVAPRPPGARVVRAGGRFLVAERFTPPSACTAAAGDCAGPVRQADGVAYRSWSDGSDLAAQERIELSFRPTAGAAALVVRARNTLLDTYLFYQALAWLGASTGEWLARFDGPGAGPQPIPTLGDVFARVRVLALTRRGWVPAGEYREIGPLAWETQAVVLPGDLADGDVRLRLEATRGNWYLDQLALADVTGEVTPVELAPSSVLRGGAADARAEAILAGRSREHLSTYPGDSYLLRFALPPALRDGELFLASRGYYYEWVRAEWLRERDLTALARLVRDPAAALRQLAPAYQRVERDMDALFWSSRARGLP